MTEDFILAMRRFVAYRGLPRKISSDNGTNLVGAHSELHQLEEFLIENENSLRSRLVSDKINWNFIPSYSPHFGDIHIWEAGVKSTSSHGRRVINLRGVLQFLSAELILNSRPCPPILSSFRLAAVDSNSFSHRTPINHRTWCNWHQAISFISISTNSANSTELLETLV